MPRTPFNSDLYLAAVTVTPVYFIALMLPGGILARYALWAKARRTEHLTAAQDEASYRRAKKQRKQNLRDLLVFTERANRGDGNKLAEDVRARINEVIHEFSEPIARPTTRWWRPGRFYEQLMLPVYVLSALTVYGEIQSVLALAHRSASANEHFWAMAALIALPVLMVASAGAAVSFTWALADGVSESNAREEPHPASDEAADQAEGPH